MVNRSRVEQLIEGFTHRPVLVLGDLMLDEFIWGKVRRISPEAPVPVVEVTDQTYILGGAGNVAANICALNGQAIPVGVIGFDTAGDRILTLMSERGMETSGILQEHRTTTLKTRIVAHNQQVVRADRETRDPLGSSIVSALADAFIRLLPSASAVVVSDYDKGVINRELLAAVLPKARDQKLPVFLDPKVYHADYYHPITLINPNIREAELLAGFEIANEERLEDAGKRLLERFQCDYALITRGEEGMSLFDRNGSHHLPTFAREVFDVSGAGDTVIATIALAVAGGATLLEAAVLANHAAGVVVGKVGTATVSREELWEDFDTRNAHSAG